MQRLIFWPVLMLILGVMVLASLGNTSARATRPLVRPDQDPFAVLQFLLGDWEAISKPGEATGSFSFTRELQGRIIMRRNHADYPAVNGQPSSTHDDLMIIYHDGGNLRADYFDNEGHLIHYTVQSGAAGQVTLISDIVANSPRFRLLYAKLANGNVSGKFELAPPGQPEAFKPYLAWEAKRK